jgi:TonB family protein
MRPDVIELGRRLDQAMATPIPGPDEPVLPGPGALAWFQVRNDGRLAGLHLQRQSGWVLLDTLVQRAVIRADSLRTLQPLPGSLRGRPVDLWLVAVIGRPDSGGTGIAMARIRHAVDRISGVTRPPRYVASAYRPHFPDAALRANIGSKMVFEFVVDTTGYVIPASIVPVRAEFREYAEEALRWVRSEHFEPAVVGRCKVQSRVRQPLSFIVPALP